MKQVENFKVLVGADVRCYREFAIRANTEAEAEEKIRACLLENGHEDVRPIDDWDPNEEQGGYAFAFCDDDERLGEFKNIKEPGLPKYQDLHGFVRKMANFTTPEDEHRDHPGSYSCPVDLLADFSDDRLFGEHATFMDMVREARLLRDDTGAPHAG
ncbi:MAG: hypothetical protein AAF468_20100 [Pseudomonadota bacterium]